MRRRKKCLVCRELYHPYSRSYRRQKICLEETCRKTWARKLWKTWSLKHPLVLGASRPKAAAWRAKRPNYWREWRAKHPGYVERNRQAQKRRNREKRCVIAKPRGLEWVHREKLHRIKTLRMIAKTKGIEGVFPAAIDGIVRYLAWRWMIAKPK